MKTLLLLAFIFCTCAASAQTTRDFAVRVTATTQASPARITLRWKMLPDTTRYTVFRKSKSSLSWGTPYANLGIRDSFFTDTAVIADSMYEYFVYGFYKNRTKSWDAAGYILAGIKAPAIHSRGAMVLIVDSMFSDSCKAGIHQLMKDLSGDGWQVLRHDVPRTLADTGVKRLIVKDYNTVPNVKAVFLLGHVAVPYSGDQNPDAHPDHKGAWPADVYYAHLTAAWTDATINNATSSYPANRNTPGDGKWDQIGWTSRAELQVGRVDFWNMPVFGKSESQLMNSYLSRDHAWKMDSVSIRKQALIDDNFGVLTAGTTSTGATIYEGFASSAWRSFPPMVTADSIATVDFITGLDSSSYLWAYGCGGGSFSSAGGIGSTGDFATKNMNGIFTMLFGSYFGDWNVQNNFLRAPLCAPTPALTCVWSGRPYWFFHQMALGEHIGYCGWHSQNNDGNLYGPFSFGYQWCHLGLMGDPSLRTDYIKPAAHLNVVSLSKKGASLTWSPSPDAGVAGYYVYRSDSGEFGSYRRISGMVAGTAYSDTAGLKTGFKYYMVRPVKLQNTPSGAYYNLGIGITDTATIYFPAATPKVVSALETAEAFPNPATSHVNVAISVSAPDEAIISLLDIRGGVIVSSVKQLETGTNTYMLDMSALPSGSYLVSVQTAGGRLVRTVSKL